MSKPRRAVRGIHAIIDEPVYYDSRFLMNAARDMINSNTDQFWFRNGLFARVPPLWWKQPNRGGHDYGRRHRKEITYGTHHARELLSTYQTKMRLDYSPTAGEGCYFREAIKHFPLYDWQRPLMEPLPIPGGRGERMSAAILSQKHVMADPIMISHQEEENPYHPANIKWPGTDAQVFWDAINGNRLGRYRFAVPQMHLSDLADFEHPFEDKIMQMFTQIPMGRNAGKSQPLPFYSTAVFARWLWNQRTDPHVYRRNIGGR